MKYPKIPHKENPAPNRIIITESQYRLITENSRKEDLFGKLEEFSHKNPLLILARLHNKVNNTPFNVQIGGDYLTEENTNTLLYGSIEDIYREFRRYARTTMKEAFIDAFFKENELKAGLLITFRMDEHMYAYMRDRNVKTGQIGFIHNNQYEEDLGTTIFDFLSPDMLVEFIYRRNGWTVPRP